MERAGILGFVSGIGEEGRAHHHSHHPPVSGTRLGITILLNLVITLSQVAGAFFSGSLSLLTDALHNFSDVVSLVISWIGNRLARRKNTLEQTFGYKRAEIIAAFINAGSLTAISILIAKTAIERFADPPDIRSGIVIALAVLSILLNGLSVLLIRRDAKESINIKSAYLHLLTDMLTSIAVAAGGVVMYFYGVAWVDSVLSLLIAAYLIYSSWGLLIQSLRILMQFTPEEIDLLEVEAALLKIDEIENIHHVHVWRLNDRQIHFEGHVTLREDILVSASDRVLERAREILDREFSIDHVTLQPEAHSECKDGLVHRE